MDWAWLVGAIVAAAGLLAVSWGHVRGICAQLWGYVVVTCEAHGVLSDALALYCWQNMQTFSTGRRDYYGRIFYVRPQEQRQLVASELLIRGRLYWLGWRPFWLQRQANESQRTTIGVNNTTYGGLTISFLRGTCDPDALIIAATQTWNAYWTREQRIRFHIRHAFGTANMLLGEIRQNSAAQAIENEADSELLSQRLLEYQMHELGAARLSPADAASSYALSPAAARVVEDIKYWQNSRSWYRQRGIPWRRGLVLHGPPGSGKTAFARLLAESLDMPIMVFHLNTLRDGELHTNWQDMLHDVPCVALIEDIDTVFRGRENHAGGQLTFDTLLNCIDGAERTDGVLVCITTNDIRHIDPALGIPCSDGSSRPGRIDCILEFGVLPEACRWQLCRQIVADYPALHADLVAAGAGDTGAQFQERCARLALREFWKQSDN